MRHRGQEIGTAHLAVAACAKLLVTRSAWGQPPRLELRGLGVLNIRQMFGDTAVKRNKYLRLIVHLVRAQDPSAEAMARITGESTSRKVLDLEVPVVELPVAAGRNLAVLAEAAVRLHLLRSKGMDPAVAFLARHSEFLLQGEAP